MQTSSAVETQALDRAHPHLSLSLVLPRDAVSVPMVRHLCGQALTEIGATEDCVRSVELAITEACSNVVNHAQQGDVYQVEASITNSVCELRVLDYGSGFSEPLPSISSFEEPTEAESGRGLALIAALMDSVSFRNEPQSGVLIRLVKDIEYVEGNAAPRPLDGMGKSLQA